MFTQSLSRGVTTLTATAAMLGATAVITASASAAPASTLRSRPVPVVSAVQSGLHRFGPEHRLVSDLATAQDPVSITPRGISLWIAGHLFFFPRMSWG